MGMRPCVVQHSARHRRHRPRCPAGGNRAIDPVWRAAMSTEDANPFQAPKAELELPPAVVSQGSLEDAMAGRYDFDIGEVMSEAWELTKGFKASYWGAAILVYGALFVVTLIGGGIAAALSSSRPHPILNRLLNGLLPLPIPPLILALLTMILPPSP